MRLQTQSRRIIPEFAVPVAPDPVDFRELSGSPKFPGNPRDQSPCLRPRRDRVRAMGPEVNVPDTAPGTSKTRAPHSCKFRGSITRLLVSLSTPRGGGLPPLHARLASGCWSQLGRAGFHPQGFYERFLSINTRPPLPSFLGTSFVLALFYHRQLQLFNFTGHLLLTTILTPHALTPPEPPTAGTSGVRPAQTLPLASCMQPTAELVMTERDPISMSGSSIFSMSPNQAIPTEKLIRFFPTRRRPTVDHSLVPRGAQRQWLQACLPDGRQPQCLLSPYPPDEFTRVGLVLCHTSQDSYPLHDIAWNSAWLRVTINRLRLYTANGSSATRLAESRMSRCGPEDSESSDGEGTRPWPGDREQYSPLPTNTSALLVRVRPLTSRFRPASASLALTVDGWLDLENNPGDKTVSSRTGPRLGDATFL